MSIVKVEHVEILPINSPQDQTYSYKLGYPIVSFHIGSQSKFLDGKSLGFTGKDTNTFLSLEAYQEFYDWVMVKILSGDKHIHWLLNVVKRDGISTKGESNNSSQTKSASFKIGDSNSKLADLKAKLEAQGR